MFGMVTATFSDGVPPAQVQQRLRQVVPGVMMTLTPPVHPAGGYTPPPPRPVPGTESPRPIKHISGAGGASPSWLWLLLGASALGGYLYFKRK